MDQPHPTWAVETARNVQAGMGAGWRALVLPWLVALVLFVPGVLAGSVILLVVGGLLLAGAVWMTAGEIGARRRAGRAARGR